MAIRILVGDARKALALLPDESVDCCISSPPYFGLRSYGGGEAEIGREDTVQGFIRTLVDVFGEVRRVLRPHGTCFVNIGDCYAGSKKGRMADGSVVGGPKQRTSQGTVRNVATRRADYGGISGKQASNAASLVAGNAICPPGLKPKDLMLVPARLAIALQDDGWWVRSEIIWGKCLSGGTHLYAKTQKAVGVHRLKDLARLDPATVQLWNGERWTQVLAWTETPRPASPLELVLRSGERIGCTPEHRWPTARGLVEAKDLVPGDVLQGCHLPNEGGAPKWLRPALWFAGLYLAEGSMSGDTIQISLHAKEEKYWRRIQSVCAYYGARCRRYVYGNQAIIKIVRAHGLRAVLRTVLAGRTAKDKRLSGQVWEWSANDLRYILFGYLNGDASWEPDSRRWRLGFTRNYGLERDLRTLAARLGGRLTLKPNVSRIGDKEYPSFKGEWRWESTRRGHHNEKDRREVVEIRRSRARRFYDVTVEDEPHLFALASGVLTHNCNPMPESVKDRPSKAHEHIWMLTKSGRHYYNNGEGMPVSDDAVKRGERAARTLASGRTDAYGLGGKKGLPEGYVAHQRKHTDDRNDAEFNTKQRDLEQRAQTAAVGTRRLRDYEDAPLEVWRFSPVKYREAHFATFPPTLVERCLAIGCPEGGVVLDPFGGAGTTGLVADRLGYAAVLCELNPDYAALSVERIEAEAPLTAEVEVIHVQEALL